MFKRSPKVLAHVAALNAGNLVTPEYILHSAGDHIDLHRRFCPHRMYPLSEIGRNIQNVVCKYHGYEWDINGKPLNNNKKLKCGEADIGKSGLILKDLVEPSHHWVDDLVKEKELTYSHCTQGSSSGSWLWMMEIQADLLHVRTGDDVIHPELSSLENLEQVNMDSGDGWIIQTCSTGWWLFIYPYTFVEWSKGCLSINYTVPKDVNNEFGFTWATQFYYDPNTSQSCRAEFEKLEDVFHEDVTAIEAQKGPYFPLKNSQNRLEDHCVHFGNWYQENLIK
jgi:hypothetical protein